jgi:NAD(P)-dependent dehydrogenase (short-subunit alcohol dehydrogenase family)
MGNRLEGRVAIVTGGARGIGKGVAMQLAEEGAAVVVADFGGNLDGTGGDLGPAEETVREIQQMGGRAMAHGCDVSKYDQVADLVDQTLKEYGRVDAMLHVAGILRDRMVFNMSEQEWDDVVAVHLTGFFNVVKPASIIMRQNRGGRIIGFSSGSGMNGNTGQANYGAAKAGITGGVRCAARDLGRYGVTSNAICPGANTRMTQSVPEASRDLRARAGIQGAQRQESIVNQLRDAKYVAPMVNYLLTDQAWNINGKCFYVSGGSVSLAHEETPFRTIAKPGKWEVDELRALVPSQLMAGVANPAPPPADLDLPGRPVAKAEA